MIFLRRDRKPDKFDSVSPLFVFCIFFLFLFFLPSFFAQGVSYLASQQRHLYNTGYTTGKLIDRKKSKKDAFFINFHQFNLFKLLHRRQKCHKYPEYSDRFTK